MVTPAITAERMKTALREEEVTPLLIIVASSEGSIITATAANKTRMDRSKIQCPFNLTFEKMVFIRLLLFTNPADFRRAKYYFF